MLLGSDAVEIRVSRETDASAFRDLRLEALRLHPEAFSADYALNERELAYHGQWSPCGTRVNVDDRLFD